jgi:uncharacterized membrane protein YedE/YeeE
MRTSARPYANGTLGGIALGVVLLLSFVFAGRGLGASGAFARVAGGMVAAVAPSLTADPALADRLPSGTPLADDWIVLEILGVFIGAGASAMWSGRWRAQRELLARGRLLRALGGGALMGLGARLAYGCTSGLALSGGALLATGAWIFIPIAFATAFALSWLARDGRREPLA